MTKNEGEPTDTFMTATSGALSRVDPQDEDYSWADQTTSQPVSYHTADGGATDLSSTTESQEEQELAGSYRYGVLQESQADVSDRASPGELNPSVGFRGAVLVGSVKVRSVGRAGGAEC